MKRLGAILLLWMLGCLPAAGQYYDMGRSPASMRWQTIRTPHNRLIYPDSYDANARRMLFWLDTVRSSVGHGFRYGTMFTPVVFHTENFTANGMMMWAPRRMELLTIPAADTYSEPWLKQLASHEYRHNVQFNNINRRFVRVLGYIFGQQASLACTGLLPFWFLEGDAVYCETQLGTFGRGLQPSFNMHYRAVGDMGRQRRNADKWFCGSFREYIPDHYALGYQLVQYSYDRYGPAIWDNVAAYSAGHPYFFFTTSIALRRFYRTSPTHLFHETFSRLDSLWHTLPPACETMRRIVRTPGSYTTYNDPIPLPDGGVVARKTDFDRPSRFVLLDPATGHELTLAHTGNVNSRPALCGNKLYWTEYRQSLLWEQRVDSRLCELDLQSGRKRLVAGHRRTLFPTDAGAWGLARAEYAYDGTYSLVWKDGCIELPDTVSVHGLAWDETTARLCFIGLSDAGMWLGAVEPTAAQAEETGAKPRNRTERASGDRLREPPYTLLTVPAHVTLRGLRAANGQLYYGSVASGKDELYRYDPATGKQYRLTESAFGAFDAAPLPQGDGLLMTVYDRNGYLPAWQADAVGTEAPAVLVPVNLTNPPLERWGTLNIDTVRYTSEQEAASKKNHPARRYRKGLHLFDFHSWAPLDFDPDRILGDGGMTFNAGITLLSQNLLASTFTNLSYGYTSGGSLLRAGLRYYGLAPKFEIDAVWGGGKQLAPQLYPGQPAPGRRKAYLDLTARVYLPLLLASGYHTRYLMPDVQFTHNNELLYDPSAGTYRSGVQRLLVSLQYTDNVRMAYRNILPRWGYAVRARYGWNPCSDRFARLWSLFLRAYLPGIGANHAVMLRGTYQQQLGGEFFFSLRELFPRGTPYDATPGRYGALSLDYQLPVAYPDAGIRSVLFLKRIRLNLGTDYARRSFRNPQLDTRFERDLWSVGGDLYLDFNLFRLPAAAMTGLRLSYYRSLTHGSGEFSVGFSIPL